MLSEWTTTAYRKECCTACAVHAGKASCRKTSRLWYKDVLVTTRFEKRIKLNIDWERSALNRKNWKLSAMKISVNTRKSNQEKGRKPSNPFAVNNQNCGILCQLYGFSSNRGIGLISHNRHKNG